jgi:hypothetical protein
VLQYTEYVKSDKNLRINSFSFKYGRNGIHVYCNIAFHPYQGGIKCTASLSFRVILGTKFEIKFLFIFSRVGRTYKTGFGLDFLHTIV